MGAGGSRLGRQWFPVNVGFTIDLIATFLLAVAFTSLPKRAASGTLDHPFGKVTGELSRRS
jgi:hypothetical protein